MADSLPVPAPPRTPTPPSDEEYPEMSGLGLDGMGDLVSPMKPTFDPKALSPMNENFPLSRYGSSTSIIGSLASPLSPMSTNPLYSPMSLDSAGSLSSNNQEDGKSPFNFKPMSLAKSPVSKSVGNINILLLQYFSS